MIPASDMKPGSNPLSGPSAITIAQISGVYVGNITFTELSVKLGVATYFAYMFGGFIRNIGCRLRPYERIPGATDRAMARAVAIAGDAFRGRRDREAAARAIARVFEEIQVDRRKLRPQVAVFGDLYTRDNEVMNQGLIRAIEEAGREVLSTPYSDYLKLIAEPYLKRWLIERRYGEVLLNKGLLALVNRLEKKILPDFCPAPG
jgi:predicted nucleotide-binding protein (sugar kinase/HSP70/actin superfamily)